MLMPLSEYDHIEKGDALYGKVLNAILPVNCTYRCHPKNLYVMLNIPLHHCSTALN